MKIAAADFRNFRNIERLALVPGRDINLISGSNGAGKTSLLEALFVAGRGQSFRHREVRPLVRDGSKSALILIDTIDEEGRGRRIGVEQGRSGRRVRIDGKESSRRSEQAQALPLQLITPLSHELIERGPGVRRRFLDWVLFHVEPDFLRLSTEFRRALQQRNSALRAVDRSFFAWDPQLAEAADAIERFRRSIVSILEAATREELGFLGTSDPRPESLQLLLRSNWDTEKGLQTALRDRRVSDRKTTTTTVGPHRSGLDILISGELAERRLSRGQQKILVYAMTFAALRVVAKLSGSRPILLIDDLPAELDRLNRGKVMQRLASLDLQAFVTGTDFEVDLERYPVTMFHVEQGRLSVTES